MTKLRVTVTVCNVHAANGEEVEGQRYSVHYPGDGSYTIDLCEAHAEPLEALREYMNDTGKRSNEPHIYTPEEVAAKRRPRKRGK